MVDLKPLGAVQMVDRALDLARSGGARVLLPAFAGGAIMACAVLALFYVERVEGIHGLRLPFAILLMLAWWARAVLLSRASLRIVETHGHRDRPPRSGHALALLRTASVAALGGWVYSWLLVLGSLIGPIGLLCVAPMFAVRGAFAPSWLARSACDRRAGFRLYLAASADSAGARFRGLMVEALVLLGAAGLAANLYAALLFLVMLLRTLVGLEVAAVESFLSLRNGFVLLVVGAATLVLFEPLRAAISALTFVDARVRRDGWDLRRSVDDAILLANDPQERRRRALLHRTGRAATVLLLLGVGLGSTQGALAQPPHSPDGPGFEPTPPIPEAARPDAPASWPTDPGEVPLFEILPEDRSVQAQTESLLARPEFREFEDTRGAGAERLTERLVEWLMQLPIDASPFGQPSLAEIPLPGPWVFLVLAGLLLLAVVVYLVVTRRRERKAANETKDVKAALRDRTPAGLMDEAATLADAGDLRAALRSLYVATLVALDRRHRIAFDPHLTNWQYLRQMARGPTRTSFQSFTRMFDHKWYGREPTTLADYERCRELASAIVDEEAAA